MSAEAPWLDAPEVKPDEPWLTAPKVDSEKPWEAAPLAAPIEPPQEPQPRHYNSVRELMLSPGSTPPAYTHQELSNALTPSNVAQTTPDAGVSALTGQPAAAGGFVEPSRTGTPGTDVQGIDTPIVKVSPEAADAYLGSNLVTAPSYRFLKAMSPERASGVAEGAAGFASGLTTGQNVAMMVGLAGSPAIVEKLVAAGFSLQAAHGAYEQSKELANETDPKKQASLATGILLNGAMATFGAIGAAKGLKAEQPAAEHVAADEVAKAQIDSALEEVIHSPESVTLPPVEETPQMPVESPTEKTAVSEQPAPEAQPQPATEAAQPVVAITKPARDFASVTELNGKPLDEVKKAIAGADTAAPEKAVAAMVQTTDGKVYFGANHSLAMAEAEAENPDLTTHDFSNVDSFVTSHGRIIGRDEALSAFKKDTSQKIIEPPVTSTKVADHSTVETPLSDITLSKDVPQFKSGADEKGVVEPIAGKYERVGTPPVQLWERANGALELISGRHRFDLAQRTGQKTIPSQIHREADGFTATDAAKLDAELNIRDEQGSTADYANYFKNAKVSQDAAESGGLLARAKGRAGFAIAQNGSEDLFALHQSGRITDAQAGAIAEAAPKNEGAQQIGIRAALDGKSADYVSNLIKAVQSRGQGESAKALDLFGSDDSAMREMEAQAKIASSIQGELRKTKAAITGASKDPARAKAEGVDVKDPEQVSKRVTEINAELSRWNNWPMHPDLVAKTRGEAVPVEATAQESPISAAEVPTLRQGENQGDLLSKQTEDLSLVGEKGTDFAKREAEKQAAEKAAQEAKDLQETQQGKLPIDEATQKAIETHASEQGYLAEPPSPVPQGERPSSELPGNEEVLSTEQSRAREKAHLDAYNLANRLAEQVARGQPDSVREAAAMAAYDNARRSIESGGRFNPEFMRKSAMRAAGDAAKKQGASLDAPLSEDGETTGKDQLADEGRTPDDAAADHEAIAKADALLKGLNPREQAIVRAVTMEGRTLREVGDELGISHERVRQIHEQALEKLRKRMAQADAISAGTKDQVFDENAMRPAAKVIAQSIDPREAAQVTPQALGIRAPLPQFLRDAIDYFTTNSPSQIWNTVKGSLDATLGKTFAKTTIADRKAGELAARWISARIAAPHLAQTFAANVLEGTGIDPVKFGAALTEDNLRSIKKSALDEGRTADAANVVSIIGAKDSPFKTEGEYQSFLASPDTQTAIQRHQSLWDSAINPMFRKAQLLDPAEPLPTRGEQTQARVNLYNDVEAKGKDVVSGTGTGNLTATTRKKSPFAIQAKGTGQSYNVNYGDMMANTFGRQLEIASKNAFEQQLVDSGNAIIGKPAKDVTLPDGEATVAFPLKRTVLIDAADGGKIPVNQNIFVRKSLAGEYRRGADVDLIKVPGALRAFNNVVNRTALAGLTDASVHVLNLGTALLTRPSVAGGVLRDSLLSAFGRADVPVIAIKALVKGFQDNRAQLSELAEIGAMRQQHPTINPMGKVIEWADKTTRLVLDDAFKNMTDAGLVDGTETNRREFVNQIGQYNKRAQGDLRRLARDSGFGPFATAGTTFNTLGLRTLTLSPGATATSAMAAASLRANIMAKWVGAFALTGSLNYLLTGNVAGRPGVPIGKIDTGLNDENKRPLSLPLFDLLGLGRALRVTGVRGFVESKRKGLSTQNALDSAATDIWNTNISPFTGPAIRFAGVASSGKQIPSVNVPRTSRVVPPGESQWQENLKQAIIDANPIIKSVALAHEPGQGVGAAIRQQIPRISLQPSQSAEFMSKYPEIVRKAQSREYVNDVIGRARKMAPTEQRSFVRESLGKLTPEDRKQAERTLKYSRILY